MLHKNRWSKLLTASTALLLAGLVNTQQIYADVFSDNNVTCKDLRVIGLTDDNQLVRFRGRRPGLAKSIGYVTGFQGADTSLIGIDFRVQDGKLYGVGNGGGVYTIDPTSAQAAWVNNLSVPLAGTFFGVDFNPAADRLRIVSDAGQNLSHNVNAGGTTAAQGTLTYTVPAIPPAPPVTPVTALGITGAAYTNNDLDPSTNTTLFDIDTTLDQVSIQSPPAAGLVVATGQLGVLTNQWVGFDIYSRLSNGVTVQNVGCASLVVNGLYGFYQIHPLTGQASFIGNFRNMNVADIAVPLNQ